MGMAAWRGSSRAVSQSPPARESAPSPSSTASARGSTATPISTRPSPTASSCRDRTAPTGHRPSCPLGRSRSRGPAASSSSRRLSFSPRPTDLIPQPRRHRNRYHGVFAPNHPLRKALTALAVGNVGKQRDAATGGEPLEPPPVSPARGPPADWGEFVQIHDDRDVFQSTDRRAARDRHPQPLTAAEREVTTKSPGGRPRDPLSGPGQARLAGATGSRVAQQ